jgi:hypothetical protein
VHGAPRVPVKGRHLLAAEWLEEFDAKVKKKAKLNFMATLG